MDNGDCHRHFYNGKMYSVKYSVGRKVNNYLLDIILHINMENLCYTVNWKMNNKQKQSRYSTFSLKYAYKEAWEKKIIIAMMLVFEHFIHCPQTWGFMWTGKHFTPELHFQLFLFFCK